MSTTVTSQQVLDALQQDPTFGQPEAFALVSEFAARLPEFVGDERMDQPVTLDGLMDVCLKFMQAILDSDTVLGGNEDINDIVRNTYDMTIGTFRDIDLSAQLAQLGITEHQALTGDQSQFNDEAKALYVAGELNYARLLVINPGALLPRAS